MQSFLRKYIIVLPLVYLFFSVFVLRGKVQYVYAAAAVLVVVLVYTQRSTKLKPHVFLAQWLMVLAAIGISAATILSIEKVELLMQPDRIASCSLSPIVACSPVIKSPQASAFGFPNSFIGLFGFTAVLTAAITILAGAQSLQKSWWRVLLAGETFGAVFSGWLFYQGVFEIGKLCLYCMLVWLVTFAMLWLTLSHGIKQKYINLGVQVNEFFVKKYELITATYAVIFILIFYRWSDYWLSLI